MKFDKRLLWFAPTVGFLTLIQFILLFGGQLTSFQGALNTMLLLTLIAGISETFRKDNIDG